MRLEKFKTKDSKKKVMIIGSISLIILMAVIVIYQSFAFFEEKQEFNVIKGSVPNQDYDLMLSLTEEVNGIKQVISAIPEKESEKSYNVEVDCDNAEGYWDYQNWNIVVNVQNTRTKCKINFKEEEGFEYPIASQDYEMVSLLNASQGGGAVSHTFNWNVNFEPFLGKRITGLILGHIVGYKFTCNDTTSRISYNFYLNDELIYNQNVALTPSFTSSQFAYQKILSDLDVEINENTTLRVTQTDTCGSPGGVYIFGILS